MKTLLTRIDIQTTGETDLINITGSVFKSVKDSAVTAGMVCVHVPGTTASITTIEWEPGLLIDFRNLLTRLASHTLRYEHDPTFAGNGYSHIRASIFGPSITLPISYGVPALGERQQIMLCDFDTRPRTRAVLVQSMGVPFAEQG